MISLTEKTSLYGELVTLVGTLNFMLSQGFVVLLPISPAPIFVRFVQV